VRPSESDLDGSELTGPASIKIRPASIKIRPAQAKTSLKSSGPVPTGHPDAQVRCGQMTSEKWRPPRKRPLDPRRQTARERRGLLPRAHRLTDGRRRPSTGPDRTARPVAPCPARPARATRSASSRGQIRFEATICGHRRPGGRGDPVSSHPVRARPGQSQLGPPPNQAAQTQLVPTPAVHGRSRNRRGQRRRGQRRRGQRRRGQRRRGQRRRGLTRCGLTRCGQIRHLGLRYSVRIRGQSRCALMRLTPRGLTHCVRAAGGRSHPSGPTKQSPRLSGPSPPGPNRPALSPLGLNHRDPMRLSLSRLDLDLSHRNPKRLGLNRYGPNPRNRIGFRANPLSSPRAPPSEPGKRDRLRRTRPASPAPAVPPPSGRPAA
jgi:hypothetical protein